MSSKYSNLKIFNPVRSRVSLVSRFAALMVVGWQALNVSANEEANEIQYARHIKPLFAARCVACHGGDVKNVKGGLDLTTPIRTGDSRTGDSGQPAIVPGDAQRSPLYLAVSRHDAAWSPMPPKEADKLNVTEIEWIRQWIDGGASWPTDARVRELEQLHADDWRESAKGVTVSTSGGTTVDWTNRKYPPDGLWGYQPVKKPATKAQGSAAIDELIFQQIPAGLLVAPPADARNLIRRATYDLTGLPPHPEEVAAFEQEHNHNPDRAISNLIDRLLESPHYGERMAQHWLDVVRYADSSGLANDYQRGNAWRYRDYVVRSFNSDKPYDQFVREQIAGDEIRPDDPEMLVAVGFLRMGPWELTGMEVAKVARQRFLDDVTNSVGESFLAHSLQCARCHDHKFDPIPTRDYYALQAVFATTQITERPAPFLPSENLEGFDEQRFLEKIRTDHQATLAALDEKSLSAASAWYADKKFDNKAWLEAVENANASAKLKRGGVFSAARNQLLQRKIPEEQIPPRMIGLSVQDIGMARIANKGLERLTWELDRYRPYALSVYNGRTPRTKSVNSPFRIPEKPQSEGELEATCVLVGGDPFSLGAEVGPGILSVLGDFAPRFDDVQETYAGRRQKLADWIADKRNPLTTRAIVNRIWMWHFGDPIAGNPNNFGNTGKRPTHPELLDWLAATLVDLKWSVKSMHRLIMTSAAYRRSAEHPARSQLELLDPHHSSYAVFKPRRLTAEELRDSMLAATGELVRTVGGIPVRPEINFEASMQPRQVMGTFAAAWVPNPLPRHRHRRSLYALKLRGMLDPALEVFNAPVPDFSCERRETSTIAPQVFTMFNGQNTHNRALVLADRALHESANDNQALNRCFQRALGRSPSEQEIELCLRHWLQMQNMQRSRVLTAKSLPLEVRRDAVEENTGERFTYVEKLYSNSEFVPDLQPHQCDVRTRALADVCLVLLNSNEFMYIY